MRDLTGADGGAGLTGAKTVAASRKRARTQPKAGCNAIAAGGPFKDCSKCGEPAYAGWLCGAGGRVCANAVRETVAACRRCASHKRDFCI